MTPQVTYKVVTSSDIKLLLIFDYFHISWNRYEKQPDALRLVPQADERWLQADAWHSAEI